MKSQKVLKPFKLLLLVVILGILPALALSESRKADVKNKQSEAKHILKQIYTMQKAYKAEKGIYWITGSAASAASPSAFWSIRIEISYSARYTYTITSTDAGNTNFTATATTGILDDDVWLDIWTINHNGILIVTSDDSDN